MEIKEIKINISENDENKIMINLNKLEVLIDDKLYGLTNYETMYIKLDKIKKEVVGQNLISIMNGKEYVLKARELFVGENLNLLLKEIDKLEKEKENKEKEIQKQKEKEVTKVKKNEIDSLLKQLEEFNKKNYKNCIENLINKSLDEKDMELFNSLKNKL